ncbi:mechanosensitive ion channel family protein, partial [Candidatus Marinamargulisbacteria bacterium SCGC AG-414-C22]
QKTANKFDDILVPLISRVLKLIVLVIGILSLAEILGLPLASLVAGLGIGGLAIAMAAKDTIANIFGSVTVVADRPFNIGDWVKINNVEGSVVGLGFRSTRIRTFYDSVITVPNSNLLTAVVDNLGQRNYRRYKTLLQLTYDTPPEKITAFCEGVRHIIDTQEYTRKDVYHVYLNNMSDSSLDVLLYCFFKVPDWKIELQARESLLLAIVTLAKSIGVDFAFPTRTLHIESDSSPS